MLYINMWLSFFSVLIHPGRKICSAILRIPLIIYWIILLFCTYEFIKHIQLEDLDWTSLESAWSRSGIKYRRIYIEVKEYTSVLYMQDTTKKWLRLLFKVMFCYSMNILYILLKCHLTYLKSINFLSPSKWITVLD